MSRSWSWVAYATYPVFTRRWFLGRSILVGIGALLGGSLVGVGIGASANANGVPAPIPALGAGFAFGLAVALIASVGPLLATIVRARAEGLRQRRGVLLAIGLGVLASFGVDAIASPTIEVFVGQAGIPTDSAPPEISPVGELLGFLFVTVLYFLFGGGVALLRYFDELRETEQSARDEEVLALRRRSHALDTRLALLQAQVEPHFLFNTLASIQATLAVDPARAEQTLGALASYLRALIPEIRDQASTDREGEGLVASTLGVQFDLCRHYLEISRLRNEAIAVEVALPDALAEEPFPPLLLLSLVENAVRHGVEARGGGLVSLRARTDEGTLVVEVRDDGPGLREGAGAGVGLANVIESLRIRYGEAAHFALASDDAGTQASISVPLSSAARASSAR